MKVQIARDIVSLSMLVPSRRHSLPIFLLACLGLAGCAGDKLDDLRMYVEQTKAKSSGRIEPLPEVKPFDTYIYKVDGRASPFDQARAVLAPLQSSNVAQSKRPDESRRKEPLEGFPLDGLRMVGTLGKAAKTWAVIKAPDGIVYRVTQGNYLGQNNGRIVRVSENKVDLTELVPDGHGAWQERQASLALAE